MNSSSSDQRQKLIPTKFRRPAASALRPFIYLAQNRKKRLGLLGLGILTGIGLPALALAGGQQPDEQPPSAAASRQHTSSTRVQINTQSSLDSGEDFSLDAPAESSNETTQSSAQDAPAASVTINGEDVPLVDGSVTRQTTDGSGNIVDIQIDVENAQTSSLDSDSSSSTDVSIESSSTTDESSRPIRGSPRP